MRDHPPSTELAVSLIEGEPRVLEHRRVADLPRAALTGFETRFDQPRGKVVYLVLDVTRRVKVGITKRPRQRIGSLGPSTGTTLTRFATTPPIMNALEIERAFKKDHHAKQIAGEWFSIDFEEAKHFLEAASWQFDSANAVAEEIAAQSTEGFCEWFDRVSVVMPSLSKGLTS